MMSDMAKATYSFTWNIGGHTLRMYQIHGGPFDGSTVAEDNLPCLGIAIPDPPTPGDDRSQGEDKG